MPRCFGRPSNCRTNKRYRVRSKGLWRAYCNIEFALKKAYEVSLGKPAYVYDKKLLVAVFQR